MYKVGDVIIFTITDVFGQMYNIPQQYNIQGNIVEIIEDENVLLVEVNIHLSTYNRISNSEYFYVSIENVLKKV